MLRKSPRCRQDGGATDNIFNDPELRMRFFIDFDDEDTTPAAGPPGGPPAGPVLKAGDVGYSPTGDPASGEVAIFEPILKVAIKTRVYDTSKPSAVTVGSASFTTSGGQFDNDNQKLISNFTVTTTITVPPSLTYLKLKDLYTEIEARIAAGVNKPITADIPKTVVAEMLADANLPGHLNDSFVGTTPATTTITNYDTDLLAIIKDALMLKETEFTTIIDKYITEAFDLSQDTVSNPRYGVAEDPDVLKAFYVKLSSLPETIAVKVTEALTTPDVYNKLYTLHETGAVVYPDGGRRRKFRRSDGRKKRSHGKRRSDGRRRGKGKRKSPKYL